MGDVSGSIKKVTLNGVTFDVMGDANVSEVGSGVSNEMIPTSGRMVRKTTKRVQAREGVVLACNGSERELLKALSESSEDFPMSYETAGGDTYRATGVIEFESRETEENRATVTLLPRGEWSTFLA